MAQAHVFSLRDYQQSAVDRLRLSFRSGKRAPLLVLPTGGGKTYVFCYIASQASERGSRVLILVHRQELLRQTSRSLERLGVVHGLIAPGASPTHDAVQVASVQTLARRIDRMTWRPDLIVVDEAHHAVAGTWAKVLAAWPAARVLGVTATPVRLDGRGLGDAFDDLVVGPSVADLVAHGHLSPFVCFAPEIGVNLEGIKSRAGDYSLDEVASRVDKPMITGDAVGHYRKIVQGAPSIAFCASVSHAQHVAEAFRAAGYSAASLDGTMDDATRARAIADLGARRLNVLTSCEIISEGTDIPVVSAAILLRPTQSVSLHLQQCGRVLRPAEGKDRAIILDHVKNIERLGFPDDEREWSLDGRPRKKGKAKDEEEVPIRVCPQCYNAHRPAPTCPHCGFVYEVKERKIEQGEGELVELDREKIQRERKSQQGKAQTLGDLLAIEKARGYRPGWAHHVWSARAARRIA